MNKRLEKRQKRQVARARSRVKLSEPDVRTPEEVAAARAVSRAVGLLRNDPHANYAAPSPSHAAEATSGAEKEDAGS
jgi:hypothetical protein